MKNAKVMLSAIVILAVVGGALAFKAKTSPGVSVYTCNTEKVCAESFIAGATFVGENDHPDATFDNATKVSGLTCESAPCSDETLYVKQEGTN